MVVETENTETETKESLDPFPDDKFDEVEQTDPEKDADSGSEEKPSDDKKEGDESETEDAESLEVSLEGEKDAPTTTKKTNRFSKRVNKLNERNAASNQRADESAAQLASANEKIRVYEAALQQKQQGEPVVAPKADDFDEGTYSPEFIAKNNEYLLAKAREQNFEQTTQSFQQNRDASQAEIDRQQKENNRITHYEGANDLGAADYEKIEDTSIETLGPEITDYIIDLCPKSSAKILYYLGKRTDEAESLRKLASQGTLGAAKLTMAIGKLDDKVRISKKVNIAPDPETEVIGGSLSSQSLQAKYDNAVKGAQTGNTKAMSRMREISKHARENNIQLNK